MDAGSSPREEIAAAVAAVRSAPRTSWVREVVLQLLAIALAVLATTAGDAGLSSVVLVPVAAAVLVARLRWPAAATLAAGGLLTVAAPGLWLAAALAAFAAGRRERDLRRVWLVLAGSGALALALSPITTGGAGVWSRLLVALIAALVLLALPALCGALVGQRRPAARLLAERNAYLERARSLSMAQARLSERAAITAEMHDVLGHRLSLLSIQAGALQVSTVACAPELTEQVRQLRTTAAAALADLRASLAVGAPPATITAGQEVGSQEGITALAEGWRRAGVQVAVRWRGEEPGDPRVRRAVDRAVREGLTNAAKHAPGAAVTIGVEASPQRVRVSVANTAPAGEAPPGPGTGLGLLGLAERARLLGGHAAWGSTPAGGFELAVDLPAQPPSTPGPEQAAAPAAAPALPSLPAPAAVQRADVLTWRRVSVALVVAAVLPLAVVLTTAVV